MSNSINSHKNNNSMYSEKDIERFWSKVNIADDRDACWEWNAQRDKDGYGLFRIGSLTDNTRRKVRTHRMAYALSFSNDPGDLHVLHKCDNPSCCNPSHLFLGTHIDNMTDMIEKGRSKTEKGEKNMKAKLTEAQVLEIRERYKQGGIFQKELAMEYGVDQTQISAIIRRKEWRHI